MQAIKVFSGGSCGAPKEVIRPRQSWLDSLTIETRAFGLRSAHRFGVLGSDQHSLWSYAMFRSEETQSFCKGLPLSPKDQLELIVSNKLSVLYAVTPLLQLLCRLASRLGVQVRCVEKIIVGGSCWPERLTGLCQQTFPRAEIFCFYGSVELGYVAYSEPSEPLQPFPSVEVRTDIQNQLWVRSPLTISTDEWLASGDCVAWVDPVSASCTGRSFYLLGRLDRVINQSGIKIQPEPIEEQLRSKLDCSELALLGLPDSLRGERLALVLGPELVSRYVELKREIQELPHPMAFTLKGAKLLQLQAWPTQANGKFSLKGLVDEIPKGSFIQRTALESF